MKLRILIGPDGTLHAVYHDVIRRLVDGPLTVWRASTVEFNTDEQVWEARDSNYVLIARDVDREVCLQKEKVFVEAYLKNQLVVSSL